MENLSTTLAMGDQKDTDITLDMMDYKFINECNNVKTLEKILRALRSGKDGYYPHLIQHCESKVAKLNPKSRSLRTENKVLKPRDLESDEVEKIQHGLGEWISDMKSNDIFENGHKEKELPPVRSSSHQVKKKTSYAKKSQRIKGSDFSAWDKYDAEEECKKVEDPEYKPSEKKTVEISHSIDSSQMNDTEKQISADKEKDKGNEAFKAGDFEEALVYYSRSISLARTAASINNRALTYLRLERYKDALEDCDQVLKLESDNIKAKLRRATTLKELTRLDEAKEDLDFVLKIEPNNARAKKILQEVESKMLRKGRKMKIMEVDDEQEEKVPSAANEKSSPKLVNGKAHHVESTKAQDNVLKSKSGSTETSNFSAIDATSKSVKVKEESLSSKSKVKEESLSSKSKVKEESLSSKSKVKEESLSSKTKIKEELLSSKSKVKEESLSSKKGKSEVEAEKKDRSETKEEDKPTTGASVVNKTPTDSPTPSTQSNEPVPPPQASLPPEIDRVKAEAGDLFRAGQYGSAAEKYTTAIDRLEAKAKSKPNLNYSHALATLYNNRAACKLKSGGDRACVADCEHVLELKPRDLKALLRRASAYEHMEKYALAHDDFRAVQNIDWTVSQAQEGANRVAKHLREIHGRNWKEAISKKTKKVPNAAPASQKPHAEATGSSAKTPHQSAKSDAAPPKLKVNSKARPKSNTKSKAKAQNSNAKTSPKSDEQKRAELVEKIFNDLKKQGNDLVKKGNFVGAIEIYSQCIKVCPTEVAGYTNRALCFLKLKKDVSAVGDCSEAIKLDANNVKAFYRRALANKSLKLYREAEKDLRKILEIEPFNKSAVNELKQLQKLIQPEIRRKMPIKEVSDDESSSDGEEPKGKVRNNLDANAHKSSKSKPKVNLASPTEIESKSNSKPNGGGSTEPKISVASASVKTTAQKGTPKTESGQESSTSDKASDPSSGDRTSKNDQTPNSFSLNVPDTLTPYEFGNLWNAVQPKDNIEMYKKILDNVSAGEIPSMVGNKTTDHMIVTFAKISRRHCSSMEEDRAYDILHYLTKAQRFSMAVMFLSKQDKAIVRSSFTELVHFTESNSVSFTKTDLDKLTKAYGL